MQYSETPVLRDIVLIGGGHSHAGVVRHFAMHPEPGVRLTLICRDTHTPYSGMLPGYIAGHYSHDDIHIDLRRLAESAGIRFFADEATGIDHDRRRVLCRNRPPVPYDLLSINIGSAPRVSQVDGAEEHAVPVKPIYRFHDHWVNLLERTRQHSGRIRIAVVGGGAGGVELLLAMQYRLCNEFARLGRNPDDLAFSLFTRSGQILPTHNRWVRRHFQRCLADRGVTVHTDCEITAVQDDRLRDARGNWHEADEVIWVTGAAGASWLRDTRLQLDESGFILVDDTLRSLSDPLVFAAGDVASQINHPREKAGVIAVRQTRPLARNLRAAVTGQPLKPWRPQKRWLALISTGDRHAVASRGAFFLSGNPVWHWKDWIDRRFMERFNDLPDPDRPMPRRSRRIRLEETEREQDIGAAAMRCGGCGAKVGASALSRALARLQPFTRSEVLAGLHDPDDAALVDVSQDSVMVHTVDFFRAFIDDPYLLGRIAANHALNDIFAMGAEARTATAIATVPPGLDSKVEDTVFQMMSGAIEVLNSAGCSLIGGHTGEGRELALGFAVNGVVDRQRILRKGGMRAGDRLILTKPLGTGTLLAAHARLAAKGRWIDAALHSMCQSSQQAARCLQEHGATACTDVTGFGLLGHVLEMCRVSQAGIRLEPDALPLLDGAGEMLAAGIVSSLQPANMDLGRSIHDQAAWSGHPRYPVLFDPQTAGGLLASVPAEQAERCVQALRRLGYSQATVIGEVRGREVRGPGDTAEPVLLAGSASGL